MNRKKREEDDLESNILGQTPKYEDDSWGVRTVGADKYINSIVREPCVLCFVILK